MAGQPASFERRAWIALVHAGPHALLAGRSAAHLFGFDGFGEPDVVEIVVPFGKGARRRPDAMVHRSRHLEPVDRTRRRSLATTTATRTILDLAADPRVSNDRLAAALDSALRDGHTSPLALARQLDRLGTRGRRGVRRLRRVLDGRPGELHSHLERVFCRRLRRAGLPIPLSQVAVRTPAGRLRRLDFLYPEQGLVVEVSGHRTHSTREDRRADAQRHRELVAVGLRWVEFTSDEVFDDWASVVADLARHLRPAAA
ncbi:MAG: endonuclease domain-containing protein [Acidimicrobiales bacterium]